MLIAVGAVVPVRADTPGASLDKPVHLCEYLVLAWCVAKAARASRLSRGQVLLLAFAGSVAYGILLESVQSLLPYRSAELMDVLCNAIGSSLGTLAGVLMPWRV